MDKLNTKRRLDLSGKFLEMGNALLTEGLTTNDVNISQGGSVMILLASLILEDDEFFKFSDLCAMYSAQRLLNSLDQSKSDFTEYLKNTSSYNEIIERINKLKNNLDNDNTESKDTTGNKPLE